MYLEKLIIKKFRSIKEIELSFSKGINILIGENNSGKTSVIDALRVCLSYGSQWRDLGIRNDEDFYIDPTDIDKDYDPIEFDLHFKIESPEDAQLCTSMVWQDPVDANNQEIQLHFRYSLETTATGAKKMRWRSWGGGVEGQQIDPNEAQLLFYTYLAPLRNAEQELRPYAKDNKITSLFKDLTKYSTTAADGTVSQKNLDVAAKNALAAKLEQVVQDEDWLGLIGTGTTYVNEHLGKADIRKKESRVHLRLLEYKYDNIVKGIVTRKPVYDPPLLAGGNEHKQRFFDVSQNGLGENNLIFASSVLGDLKNRRAEKKEHYYSLLIEEPEAHLHPQRQNTFFNYLNNLQDLGLQIFITTHSPTLTAKANLDNIIVIQHPSHSGHPFTFKNSELSSENKEYLRKFLDVTKSHLFFSNGTILVEGISEALLLPVFADIMGEDYHIDHNGIEIVNIGGIAFEPFAKLYNSADEKKRLPTKCSILTDDDRGILSARHFVSEDQHIDKPTATTIYKKLQYQDVVDSSNRIVTPPGHVIDLGDLAEHAAFVEQIINERRDRRSGRADNAAALQSGNLTAHIATYTFEYELMVASEINYRYMMAIYKNMHPRTTFLAKTAAIKDRALEFVAKLDANKDKSTFAAFLAQSLATKSRKRKFVIPAYIQTAIQHVIQP